MIGDYHEVETPLGLRCFDRASVFRMCLQYTHIETGDHSRIGVRDLSTFAIPSRPEAHPAISYPVPQTFAQRGLTGTPLGATAMSWGMVVLHILLQVGDPT